MHIAYESMTCIERTHYYMYTRNIPKQSDAPYYVSKRMHLHPTTHASDRYPRMGLGWVGWMWNIIWFCQKIESCIDEWSSGAQTNKMFTVDEYQDVLNEHLNNLMDFDEHTKAQGLLPKLLSRLHDNGRAFEAAIKEYNECRGVSSDDDEDE
ncbi:uncharacterized protein EDB91DRAFT_1084057 [Suillus paluster]|uniref:uncharacterized protein n=1 Tax=Suillus paluster TaxID=48578 RepID=UPI001B8757C4|nr:uncharacterized protein EDB91DRAFT_1084057 [Suillus paluster]KAG1734397.1 hypothetical protein EDB91DRAFT_1084057 [Suillus paluster]